jgi:hypothetical protein
LDSFTKSSLWVFCHLIEQESLDFVEFEQLGFLAMVQSGILSTTADVLVPACKVVCRLVDHFSFVYAFNVTRLIALLALDVERTTKSDRHVAACAACALRAIVRSQRPVAEYLLHEDFFGRLFDIFARVDVVSKIALVGVFAGLIGVMNFETFPVAFDLYGESPVSLFSLLADLCETEDTDTLAECFSLLSVLFRGAQQCGMDHTFQDCMETYFELDWLREVAAENPIVASVLCEILPLSAD